MPEKADRLQTEQEHQRQAFAVYAGLGARRSYRRVAEQMGVSVSAVKLWAQSFGWQKRLQEQEADKTRQLADRATQQGSAESQRNLKIVQAALIRLAKGIAEGSVKMQMGDLDRLVRLEEHLREDLGIGTKTDISKLTNDELLERMRELRDGLGEGIARLEGNKQRSDPGSPAVDRPDGGLPSDSPAPEMDPETASGTPA